MKHHTIVSYVVLLGFVAAMALSQEVIESVTLPTNHWSINRFIGNHFYSTTVFNADKNCQTARLFVGTPVAGSLSDYRKIQVSAGQLLVSNCTSEDCTTGCDGSISLDLTRNYTQNDFTVNFNVNSKPEFISGTYVVIVDRNSSQCSDPTNTEDISAIQFIYPGCFTEYPANTTQNVFCNATGLYVRECPFNQCNCANTARKTASLNGYDSDSNYNACLITAGSQNIPTVVVTPTSHGAVIMPALIRLLLDLIFVVAML